MPAPMQNDSRILLEAIARRMCVAALYNQARVMLAPHILYTVRGDLFVDAVTVKRNSAAPRELKLGTFKCSGLRELTLTSRPFELFRGFDPNSEKYREQTLFVVSEDEPQPN
jgi:hypothetical protein